MSTRVFIFIFLTYNMQEKNMAVEPSYYFIFKKIGGSVVLIQQMHVIHFILYNLYL